MAGDRSANTDTVVQEGEQEWQECTSTNGAIP